MVHTKNWLLDNLYIRSRNPMADYKVWINIQEKFSPLNFIDECLKLTKSLCEQYDKVFLGLSGGYDSEFVAKCFLMANQKFIPIISVFNGNQSEKQYAFKFCKTYNINPVVLELTNNDLIELFYHNVWIPFKGTGIYSLGNIAAARYANKNGNVYITAENFFADENSIRNYSLYVGEWEEYTKYLFPNLNTIQFMKHTPAMVYASLKALGNENVSWSVEKCRIYNIPYREKMRPIYDEKVLGFMKNVFRGRKLAKSKFSFGTKEQFLSKLVAYRS